MTQPPSQQPPQGGFGAPEDPAHGTPGPPAQPPRMPPEPPQGPPPAPPGYGYPQGPGPYQQQPGPYGAPGPYQQQPGPYGAQPGPYGQLPNPYGGGHPPQHFPGPPVPPPGGGGKSFFRSRAGVVVAAAVALLVVGGGSWVLLGGEGDDGAKPAVSKSDDAKPSGSSGVDQGDGSGGGRAAQDDLNAGRRDGESKVLWLATNDVDLPRNGADVYGPWFAGDTVVKAMYRQVVGYSAADGTKKWTLPLPAEVCAAPVAPTADGKLVIGIKNGSTDKSVCNQLQMVDLTTGKGGWKKEVAEQGAFDMLTDITLAISGDTVTAARTGNSNAYRVSDGKELFGRQPGQCQPYAFAGGPRLIAAESCPTGDLDVSQNQVQELDAVTGKPKWTYKLTKNWVVDKVYSVEPLVVSIKNDEKKTWSVVALNADGTPRSQIQGGDDTFQPSCGGSFVVFGQNLEGCVGVAADAGSFYMSTAPDGSGLTRTNELVAFDLDTGKPKWRAKAPAGRMMTPLRMEGGNVLVYLEATYDTGGAVATVAPAGGAPRTLQRHPASTAEIESSFYSPKYAYAGGRFYVTGGRVSAGNDAEEKATKTMMAFGE
ncbi:PQQ-binding-like beta-propeller repeat protein [Streptomyces sp. AK02-01A]|uniref:outer membrane protein assembly factor BamB family protein n=1 Tax=Streptomyces sp. AK02-01A TaxID=3028648 RepID=UPI0029A0E354|nr:PQQ-binding-like beta-propeller repeat protein [Streptomyces sp. AK02-01A]MDX3851344.1 PQQ-binding-like beta-propeller repeat protein [Streptomyces sp. AK02-01A]